MKQIERGKISKEIIPLDSTWQPAQNSGSPAEEISKHVSQLITPRVGYEFTQETVNQSDCLISAVNNGDVTKTRRQRQRERQKL